MKKQKLSDLAKVIRSKNAGPFEVTYDIMFEEIEQYEYVKRTNFFTNKNIAPLLGVTEEDILHIVFFNQAMAIKITTKRQLPSGSPGERDVYGAQAYPPLLTIEI